MFQQLQAAPAGHRVRSATALAALPLGRPSDAVELSESPVGGLARSDRACRAAPRPCGGLNFGCASAGGFRGGIGTACGLLLLLLLGLVLLQRFGDRILLGSGFCSEAWPSPAWPRPSAARASARLGFGSGGVRRRLLVSRRLDLLLLGTLAVDLFDRLALADLLDQRLRRLGLGRVFDAGGELARTPKST